jgi:hypothetical protein
LATSGNLDENADINRAWKSIIGNIKIWPNTVYISGSQNFVSADIVHLSTSNPSTLKLYAYQIKTDSNKICDLKCLTTTYFQVDDKFYQQK